jgi:hypothetical protein
VYANLKADEVPDVPFFILPSSTSVVDDMNDNLNFPVITRDFVKTTIMTYDVYGKTILVLPSSFDLNGALHENFIDGGYVYAEVGVDDIGNDPFVIEPADTRVSVRDVNDETGVEGTMVMKSPFTINEYRFPINDALKPFDPYIRYTIGFKQATRKRLIRVSRSDGKSGVVFQDEESNDIYVTWFDGVEGTDTILLHSGTDFHGEGFNMYGAASDGDSSVFIFIVSRFQANKDEVADVNGNYCPAKLIECDAFTGNTILTKDVDTLEQGLNIRAGSGSAGSLAYRPAEGSASPILALLAAKGRWDGHQVSAY